MSPLGISVLRCVRLLRIFKITRYFPSDTGLGERGFRKAGRQKGLGGRPAAFPDGFVLGSRTPRGALIQLDGRSFRNPVTADTRDPAWWCKQIRDLLGHVKKVQGWAAQVASRKHRDPVSCSLLCQPWACLPPHGHRWLLETEPSCSNLRQEEEGGGGGGEGDSHTRVRSLQSSPESSLQLRSCGQCGSEAGTRSAAGHVPCRCGLGSRTGQGDADSATEGVHPSFHTLSLHLSVHLPTGGCSLPHRPGQAVTLTERTG